MKKSMGSAATYRPFRRLWAWGLALLVVSSVWLGLKPAAAAAENYNRENLVMADFAGKDLTPDDFTKANMRQADLNHAIAAGVRFFATNLEAANLEGTDLRFAVLDSARLVNASLKDALLEGAFAMNADFRGADITGADFTDVLLRSDAQNLLCQTASGTNPITGQETRDTLMCP